MFNPRLKQVMITVIWKISYGEYILQYTIPWLEDVSWRLPIINISSGETNECNASEHTQWKWWYSSESLVIFVSGKVVVDRKLMTLPRRSKWTLSRQTIELSTTRNHKRQQYSIFSLISLLGIEERLTI